MNQIESQLLIIEKKSKAIINMGNQLFAITPKTEVFDLFLISVLNRTVNLNKAFVQLIRDNNFIAAAPFIRINLDTLLRIYASGISDFDRNTFALKVISGEKIRKMKIHNSKINMQDVNLVEKISSIKDMEWVKDIYETGNSFIHFSDNIIFSSPKKTNHEERKLEFTIGMHDYFIDEKTKLNSTIWMNKIIDSIVIQAQIYMLEKCQKYGVDIKSLNNI